MNTRINIQLRRERVKAMLLEGADVIEIAEYEGVARSTILSDVQAIGVSAILKRQEDVVERAFENFAETAGWAIEEAAKMHESDSGGRLDCLGFVVAKKKEMLDVAQSLGLLERMPEQKKVDVELSSGIPEDIIRNFGDYLAKHMAD